MSVVGGLQKIFVVWREGGGQDGRPVLLCSVSLQLQSVSSVSTRRPGLAWPGSAVFQEIPRQEWGEVWGRPGGGLGSGGYFHFSIHSKTHQVKRPELNIVC